MDVVLVWPNFVGKGPIVEDVCGGVVVHAAVPEDGAGAGESAEGEEGGGEHFGGEIGGMGS